MHKHEDIRAVRFNVPLDALWVILATILKVRWPNRQFRSTEGQRLVNQVNGQSHQAQSFLTYVSLFRLLCHILLFT